MLNRQTAIPHSLYLASQFLLTLALLCIVLISPTPAPAQLLFDDSESKTESPMPETSENIDEAIGRLQESLVDARQRLRAAKDTPASVTPAELGATTDEAQRRLSLLYERVHIFERHIAAYQALKDNRAANENLAREMESWIGFEEAPPYPISLGDDLRNAMHAQRLKIKNDEVKKSIAEDDLMDARMLLKSAEQRLRKVNEELENSTGKESQTRLQWLYSLAQLENTVAKAKALASETERQAFEEALAYYYQNIAFLDRKLQVASSNSPFTKQELEKKLATIAEARKASENSLSQAYGHDVTARERLEEARQALLSARKGEPGEQEGAATGPETIEHLERVVEMRKAWSETTSLMVEAIELSIHEFSTEELAWENRYRLASGSDDIDLKESLKEVEKRLEKLRGHQSYFESNLKIARSLLINLQSRTAAWDPSEEDKKLAEQMVEAYTKRMVLYARGVARISELIQLLERWREEIVERREAAPVTERLLGFSSSILKVAENIWHYELFSAEDTIIVDGRPITERRPVTVSKVVRALLILAIGIWLSAFLARRVRNLSTKRFKAEQNIALMVEKGFRAVIIISVIFFALVTVKIPLTVFAFLGGALAIGIGFGAQNLINNFISGIILLLERPIKVGDLVEVEGKRGRVIGIGARCSEVRGFDGINMLVPNSSFLEKNVVNWTHTDRTMRTSVSVGVAYGSPTRDVARIIEEAISQHGKILKFPEPVILFEEFGDNALIFNVYFWVEISSQMDMRVAASDIRYMLDKRFREAGITIAFPQRDVHFDHPKPIQVQMVTSEEKEGSDKKKSD